MFSKLTTQAYIAVTESIRKFKNDERGVTAIEYGLIAVAVAVLIVAAFYGDDGLVKSLQDKFSKLTESVTKANVGN
ncbi:Flp family type IVb pilin [Pasteurella multocida]|uniref:Flp family type IVb pilin n=1 Tax=Pasteurella multocida TaxID=747 RepID=UPI002023D429|nr:Flp family type IVb pilin [Pasteurella multocida]MDY0642532.1 Flp family type IVb pilin [Pasteurella multocida]MEB3481271.1 Flp family type IVb pilin [Pasteurella multocida]MEE3748364.1 Flp family type IVb pilin [Pasteurella multocida]URJ92104.1 Flp family type IVb pilin [Pasteurella multocida]URK00735.1 Flp family type IVb pilin [Pasteurella multocida]